MSLSDVCLLDTDILTEVTKAKDPVVLANAAAYLQQRKCFSFSAMTVYEVRRGLLYKAATAKFEKFNGLVGMSEVLEIDNAVLGIAAELWAEARHRGKPHSDADILIASTALSAGIVLVTGNKPHFDWIDKLSLLNWRETF